MWSVSEVRALRPRIIDSLFLRESLDQLCFARQPEMLCLAKRTIGMGEFLRYTRQCFSVDMNTGGKIAIGLGTSYE
jgi:hypothetical protein